MKTPASVRFAAKVDRQSDDSCWPWLGRLNQHGYGVFDVWRGSSRAPTVVASRYALEAHLGRQLAPDEMACHHCDNRRCVNPAHLFVGTARDNMQDAVKKGRTHKWRGARQGQSNPKAKLTEGDVRQIKRLIQDGGRTGEIATKFGVSLTAVCEIKSGRNWGHVSL